MMEAFNMVVTCARCGQHEYWGHMTYSNLGGTVCRACIYREWEMLEKGNRNWHPNPKVHLTYPDDKVLGDGHV